MSKDNETKKYSTAGIKMPFWSDLHLLKLEVELGTRALRMLCSNQEDGLNIMKRNFEGNLNNDTFYTSLDDEQKGSYRSQVYGMIDDIHDELERQQRFSMCMTAYSFFEGRLREICISIENAFEFKVKINDLNASQDLVLYNNYLEKVFEANLNSIERFFTPINQQKKTRNIIAHQDGWASAEQAKKLVLRDGLKVEKRGDRFKIEIVKISYLLKIIDSMESYLYELLPIIDARYNILINKSKE